MSVTAPAPVEILDANGDRILFHPDGTTQNLGPDPRLTGNAKIAFDLATKGYRVHPLAPKEKKPVWSDWPNRATNDPKLALAVFAGTDYNVGIACGHDITALDADGAEGLEALAALDIPAGAPLVRTPSKCAHVYLRTPPGLVLPNRAKMWVSVKGGGKPLDVRGAGGQVVAPGCSAWSRHAGVAPLFGPYVGNRSLTFP